MVGRSGQMVDTGSAEDFMREILERMSNEDLIDIAAAVERKSKGFAHLLGEVGAENLSREQLRSVLRSIFSTRRKADAILDEVGPERLGAEIELLLRGSGELGARLEHFDEVLSAFPEQAFDLPSELLHFTAPDQFWLWTRWIWDPRTQTGALPLVTMDEVDLGGDGRGEVYLNVGQAMAFINETGKATGFTTMGAGLLGADVFLAGVYGVYMYTVLRLRMTQEFNKIVPQLNGLIRRFLGVYHLEV